MSEEGQKANSGEKETAEVSGNKVPGERGEERDKRCWRDVHTDYIQESESEVGLQIRDISL